MTVEKGLFLVNKKAKEIRDMLDFYRKNGIRKEFRILIGQICGPGAEERLQETVDVLRKRKKYLYSIKFTFLKKYGKPVEVSLRGNQYGMTEVYLIYEYKDGRYHMPATVEQVVQAGFQIPDHYDMGSAPIPALTDPINEEDVKEAINVLLEAIDDMPLQEPPYHVFPMTLITTSSYGINNTTDSFNRQVRVFKGFAAYKRYMALTQKHR